MSEAPETVAVNAKALRSVLMALNGPSHYIDELQAIRSIQGEDNPINRLIKDFNEQVENSTEAG